MFPRRDPSQWILRVARFAKRCRSYGGVRVCVSVRDIMALPISILNVVSELSHNGKQTRAESTKATRKTTTFANETCETHCCPFHDRISVHSVGVVFRRLSWASVLPSLSPKLTVSDLLKGIYIALCLISYLICDFDIRACSRQGWTPGLPREAPMASVLENSGLLVVLKRGMANCSTATVSPFRGVVFRQLPLSCEFLS